MKTRERPTSNGAVGLDQKSVKFTDEHGVGASLSQASTSTPRQIAAGWLQARSPIPSTLHGAFLTRLTPQWAIGWRFAAGRIDVRFWERTPWSPAPHYGAPPEMGVFGWADWHVRLVERDLSTPWLKAWHYLLPAEFALARPDGSGVIWMRAPFVETTLYGYRRLPEVARLPTWRAVPIDWNLAIPEHIFPIAHLPGRLTGEVRDGEGMMPSGNGVKPRRDEAS